jgi:hypothetical protein
MSVHQRNEPTGNFYPLDRQGPSITAHPEAKWILTLIWLLVPFSALWGSIIQIMILKGNKNGLLGQSWSFLPRFTGKHLQGCIAAQCTDGTSVLNIAWTSKRGQAGMVGTIFLIAAFQAVVTLSLHCAELLVDVLQDEYVFRSSITPKGTDPRYNNFLAGTWRNKVLSGFKVVAHWVFGLSINVGYLLGVNMYPPQIFYFTAVMFVFAIFATFVSFERPRGPLPATYGHLQTIADLVDEWEDRMFWGHKFSGNPSYAGMSWMRLPMPKQNELYGGIPGSNATQQFEIDDSIQNACDFGLGGGCGQEEDNFLLRNGF